jgi:hypothetical protein|eukprot:Stramenopile-MAST_4_protein_4327
MNERPPIIGERLGALGRKSGLDETSALFSFKKLGYLRLFTIGSTVGMVGYFAFFYEFKNPTTGEPYEHVFSPLRRLFWRKADKLLGVTPGDKVPEESPKGKIQGNAEFRITPKELKEMRDSGMSHEEILRRASERYEQARLK